MNLSLLGNYSCTNCNALQLCTCTIFKTSKSKKIYRISEEILKKKKWVTLIVGELTQIDYRYIKVRLGTGGVFLKDKTMFRGKIAKKVKGILCSKGYEFESKE